MIVSASLFAPEKRIPKCARFSQSPGPWGEPHRRPLLPISSDYHCLQASTLLQLARKTNSTDTAKALLKLAGEYIELAEEWRDFRELSR